MKRKHRKDWTELWYYYVVHAIVIESCPHRNRNIQISVRTPNMKYNARVPWKRPNSSIYSKVLLSKEIAHCPSIFFSNWHFISLSPFALTFTHLLFLFESCLCLLKKTTSNYFVSLTVCLCSLWQFVYNSVGSACVLYENLHEGIFSSFLCLFTAR